MRHVTEGILRRLVDDPVGVGQADRDHVARCATCKQSLAEIEADARAASLVLSGAPAVSAADSEVAWQRLNRALAADAPAPSRSTNQGLRWRTAVRSPAVAAVGALALVTGAGAAAANDWLDVFHTDKLAPVAVSEKDLVQLPDLTAYGNVEVLHSPQLAHAADKASAEQTSGLGAPIVSDLPQGVTGDPSYDTLSKVSAAFTFSTAKAEAAAGKAGKPLPTAPSGLDGSKYTLDAGPGIAAEWTEGRGLPALIVGRAVAPTAHSNGVPFDVARDYLLSLPGISDDVAAQLRGFSADGSTLPLPVPAKLVRTTTTDVGGRPATLFTSRDGSLAGVVWVQDGMVTAVAGSLSDDEVLAVARSLRWDK